MQKNMTETAEIWQNLRVEINTIWRMKLSVAPQQNLAKWSMLPLQAKCCWTGINLLNECTYTWGTDKLLYMIPHRLSGVNV